VLENLLDTADIVRDGDVSTTKLRRRSPILLIRRSAEKA